MVFLEKIAPDGETRVDRALFKGLLTKKKTNPKTLSEENESYSLLRRRESTDS